MDMASLVSSGPTCQKLSAFITKVRNCKSPAEETVVVEKECAAIRATLKEDHYRHRNIAKLMFVDLLGYPVKFGQMDCLRLLASNFFFEKRIGYLALPVLLDRSTNLLMLATNTMKNDMTHGNQYVVGAAMTCLANVGTSDMMEPLQAEIDDKVSNNNPMLRKKALILAAKYVRTQPHVAAMYSRNLALYLGDRNHGTLMSCLALEAAILDVVSPDLSKTPQDAPGAEADPFSDSKLTNPQDEIAANIIKSVPVLVNLERELIASSSSLVGSATASMMNTHGDGVREVGYARHNQYGIKHGTLSIAEFDYQGLCDPFLQVKILQTLNKILRVYPGECASHMKAIIDLVNVLLMQGDGYKNSALGIVQEALKLACQILTVNSEQNSSPNISSDNLDRTMSDDLFGLVDQPKKKIPTEPTLSPGLPNEYLQALKQSLHPWVDTFLKHKDATVKIAGAGIVLRLPAAHWHKSDALLSVVKDLLEYPDRMVQMKSVALLRHLSNKENAVSITETLLNFLLVVSDPVPTASLREQPMGKDIQFSGKTAVVIQDSSGASSTAHQINIVQTRLLNLLIDTLENLISSYAPSRMWEVSSLIRLTKLVGNMLTEKSRIHMCHVFLRACSGDENLYLSLCSQMISGLKDNIYNAPLASLVCTMLCAAKKTQGENFDHGNVILNLIETVMITYGYGIGLGGTLKPRRNLALAIYDDQDNLVSGAFASIGIKGIVTYPSSSIHEFSKECILVENPQVFIPADSRAAAIRSKLSECMVHCLARTAVTFPTSQKNVIVLLQNLRNRSTCVNFCDMVNDYILGLLPPGEDEFGEATRILDNEFCQNWRRTDVFPAAGADFDQGDVVERSDVGLAGAGGNQLKLSWDRVYNFSVKANNVSTTNLIDDVPGGHVGSPPNNGGFPPVGNLDILGGVVTTTTSKVSEPAARNLLEDFLL